MKLEVIKSDVFVNAMKLLSVFGNEQVLRFEKDKVLSIGQDNIASLQRVELSTKIFSKYPKIEHPVEIFLRIDEFQKAIAGVNNGVPIKIDFGENFDKLDIQYKNRKLFTYKLRLLDSPNEYSYDDSNNTILKYKVDNFIIVELEELLSSIDKLIYSDKHSDNKVKITLNDNGCFLTDVQYEKGRSIIEMLALDNKKQVKDGKAEVVINKNFLTALLIGLKPITKKVLIQFKSDFPIKIRTVDQYIKVDQMIAPIVEPND